MIIAKSKTHNMLIVLEKVNNTFFIKRIVGNKQKFLFDSNDLSKLITELIRIIPQPILTELILQLIKSENL